MNPMLAFWGLGAPELIFFSVIVLLLFGSRLPSVMRSLGQSVTSFKTGLKDGEEKPEDKIGDTKNQ